MIRYADIPGIMIHPILPESAASLRFEIVGELKPEGHVAAAIGHMWEELRRENPRLFDGPILLADGLADGLADCHALLHDRLIARRSTYRVLATAAHVGMQVRALGVQALVTGVDDRKVEHVLMGRRGSQTRVYQGLWENAPSGTIVPPPPGEKFIDWPHFSRALMDEGLEELGLNLSASNMGWMALVDDGIAQSLDVVLSVLMHDPIDPRRSVCASDDRHRWEYLDTAWVPRAKVMEWIEAHASAVSPATRGLVRWWSKRPL